VDQRINTKVKNKNKNKKGANYGTYIWFYITILLLKILRLGCMQDGSTWFMNSPEQNLPMILADNGFDVWVVNARGTKFSRKHTSLDTSSEVCFFLNNIYSINKVRIRNLI
jgi:hypothetical protein